MSPRYGPNLFVANELECFETIQLCDQAITALAFSLDHSTLAFGTGDGHVFWGDNQWWISKEKITMIMHLPHFALAVAAGDGIIYVLRHRIDTPFEAFRPSIRMATRPIIIVGVPGTSKVFVAQGEAEILVWDLAAFLLIDCIQTSATVIQLTVVKKKLFCALENGIIHRINMEECQIEETFEFHLGKAIVRIGEHNGHLYSVLDSGGVYEWGDISMTLIGPPKEGIIDCLLHPNEEEWVVVKKEGVMLEEVLIAGSQATCCCFDELRPLLAIGNMEGSIAIWRLGVH
jgi:hypothetical protein